MDKQDYKTTLTVHATTKEAFEKINCVSTWWTADFEGHSDKLNDIFTVRFGETFITVKIVEFIPYSKITWQVIDCYKHWLKDKKEWKDTRIVWEIAKGENDTNITFTHIGLVPGIECYNGCENAWNFYINDSLLKLISAGNGVPA